MKIEDIFIYYHFESIFTFVTVKTTDCHCIIVAIVVAAIVDVVFVAIFRIKRLPINRYCFKKSSRIFIHIL